MTLTTYDTSPDSYDLAALNLSRLLARLEYNLLSSAADLRPLRQSDYQRKRVGANIDYARTTLQNLERNLPQIKPSDHRQTLQTNLAQQRLVLSRLQDFLDRLTAEAETSRGRKQQHHAAAAFSTSTSASTPSAETEEDSDSDSEPLDGEDLLGTPEDGSTTDEVVDEDRGNDTVEDQQPQAEPQPPTLSSALPTPTATEADSPLPPTTTPAPARATTITTTIPPTQPSATLRNRNIATTAPQSSSTLTATGTSLHPAHPSSSSPTNPNSNPNPTTTEETLVSSRAEQEDLTTSLLSLASQLKSSSQAFHASLDAEKSVLARAVDGLDRTTTSMESAERRMGTLRRMSEGKGWWGRMMLYAWIFGLWIVAILIVYVGPKLRF
ncbi:hypothetical protein ASPACDRAFT_109648 [Aspergillus aculeatus ATCC 16872]|uniref:Synaptobrevin n=1 Tax=Aspergillus aculeatus (strain ATCC 16872 / CBS 172.66 / WB 5094) TaxID=690307 RepID=A0A1L9X8W7_ASPA1|nr:uncharacterized protein ASPACDRAFT_109648 [Aspergillus aculeatus ATCC 16872]OJK04778.1 hypothetical protein ASPACDRAFT_109648 [Aspergillus aculeatus ATCC 16872]